MAGGKGITVRPLQEQQAKLHKYARLRSVSVESVVLAAIDHWLKVEADLALRLADARAAAERSRASA